MKEFIDILKKGTVNNTIGTETIKRTPNKLLGGYCAEYLKYGKEVPFG